MSAEAVADADINQWFHRHVQAELKVRGWSARELARRAGVSVSVFTRIGRGHGVALANAARIAGALGVPIGDLTVPVECKRCDGKPPAGFTCGLCGKAGPET